MPRTAGRCAASPRRSGDVDVVVAVARLRARHGGARRDERRRARARPRRREDERRHAPRARRSTCASSPRSQLGAARLYFTGSKGHNIKLRQRALARGWTLNEYALSEIEGGKVDRERDRGADLRGARPPVDPAGPARGRRRDRGGREGRAAEADRRASAATSTSTRPSRETDIRRLEEVVAAAKARGYRVARHHRPRRGHALRRRPRGAPRAAREDPRAASRARRLAAAPPRRRAEHRAERRARLRPRVPRRLRLLPRLGARPLRARSGGADEARRRRRCRTRRCA